MSIVTESNTTTLLAESPPIPEPSASTPLCGPECGHCGEVRNHLSSLFWLQQIERFNACDAFETMAVIDGEVARFLEWSSIVPKIPESLKAVIAEGPHCGTFGEAMRRLGNECHELLSVENGDSDTLDEDNPRAVALAAVENWLLECPCVRDLDVNRAQRAVLGLASFLAFVPSMIGRQRPAHTTSTMPNDQMSHSPSSTLPPGVSD